MTHATRPRLFQSDAVGTDATAVNAIEPSLQFYSAVGITLPSSFLSGGEALFLAGADEACQLRLGGEEMPLVHSVLRSTPFSLTIESACSASPAVVNGQPVSGVRLAEGDDVRLGDYLFTACASGARTGGVEQLLRFQGLVSDAPSNELDDVLTAAELAELLDAEMRDIQSDSARRTAGAQKLIAAALSVHGKEQHVPSKLTAEQVLSEIRELASFVHHETQNTTREIEAIEEYLDKVDANSDVELDALSQALEIGRQRPRSYRASA